MKEITRIHLALVPYNIEIGAKKELEKYLASVEKSLVADEDAMREIEARIAEILTEDGVTGEKTVTSKQVESIIARLGEPSEFADEEALQEESKSSTRHERRLFRDIDSQMLFGVCSGVAAYFKADVTLVRLLAVVLIFLTAGVMIPIYIVMAIITPAAKTAAQKLQMAGEPVTLASLKDQSALMPSSNDNRQILLRVIGTLAGVGLLTLAVSVIIGLSFVTWRSYEYVFAAENWWVVPSAFAIGLAGILFVIMCLLLAYTSITFKINKKIGYSLLAVIVSGLLLFGAGVVGMKYQGWHSGFLYETKTLDANILEGVKKLKVDGKYEKIQVSYEVGTGNSATYTYGHLKNTEEPKVKLTRDGETLVISVEDKTDRCKESNWCGSSSIDVSITGPALDELTSQSGYNIVYYNTSAQDNLKVNLANSGEVVLSSRGVIKNLVASLSSYAKLNTLDANVETADLTVSGRTHSVDMAQLKSINFNAPQSCDAGNKHAGESGIRIEGTIQMTLRGAPFDYTIDYPCLDLTTKRGLSD